MVGYSAIKSLAEGIKRAGGKTDTESMIKAFAGLKLTIPFGPIEYRTLDNQSTMGAYVGKLASKDGKGVMVDFRYVDGAAAQPRTRKCASCARPIDPRAARPCRGRAVAGGMHRRDDA